MAERVWMKELRGPRRIGDLAATARVSKGLLRMLEEDDTMITHPNIAARLAHVYHMSVEQHNLLVHKKWRVKGKRLPKFETKIETCPSDGVRGITISEAGAKAEEKHRMEEQEKPLTGQDKYEAAHALDGLSGFAGRPCNLIKTDHGIMTVNKIMQAAGLSRQTVYRRMQYQKQKYGRDKPYKYDELVRPKSSKSSMETLVKTDKGVYSIGQLARAAGIKYNSMVSRVKYDKTGSYEHLSRKKEVKDNG